MIIFIILKYKQLITKSSFPMRTNIVVIFYHVDEFCKRIQEILPSASLNDGNAIKKRNRKFKLSDSEVISILIMFHQSHYRDLKTFYLNYICTHCKDLFPNIVSYNRFVELQQKAILPMVCFMQMCCLGRCTGISFIDSTPIRVCHPKRELPHKTFKGIAQKGKSTMGWFFGFKLHLVINDRGEIIDFLITRANVDDRDPLKDKTFHKSIFGKLFADKGYISTDLFEKLFVDGIHLVTGIRKNMKNSLMHLHDKILLRKRYIIETINDQLKNICQIEHTRHRSFNNFVSNIISGLIAYNLLPKKPSLNLEIIKKID